MVVTGTGGSNSSLRAHQHHPGVMVFVEPHSLHKARDTLAFRPVLFLESPTDTLDLLSNKAQLVAPF